MDVAVIKKCVSSQIHQDQLGLGNTILRYYTYPDLRGNHEPV